MDPQPRRELATLIAQEGIGLAEDPQRIKALLMDRCPESRTEMGLLVAAAEDEIPSRLARSSDSIFRDGEIARAVMDLKHTRRLDEGAAEWVVRSWAWALGILDEEPVDDLESGAQPSPLTPDVSNGPASFSSPAAGQTGPPIAPGPSWSYPPSGHEQPWTAASSPSAPAGPTSFPSGQPAQSSPPPWMIDQGGPANSPTTWASSPGHTGTPTSGWGPPPSQPPNAPAPTGIPPRGPRRTPLAIGGAVLVVAILVGAVIVTRTLNDSPGPAAVVAASSTAPPTPTTTLTTPPTVVTTTKTDTTTTSPAEVTIQITDTLATTEIWETATIYSASQQLGQLRIDGGTTTDSITLRAAPGIASYELEVSFEYVDSNTAQVVDQMTSGQGTINAHQGATYAVDLTPQGTGWVATLRQA